MHYRVRREMLCVYTGSEVPSYLDAHARELLEEGRSNFSRLGLEERSVIATGRTTSLFCWRGDRVLNTILAQLGMRGLGVSHDGLALTVVDITPGELLEHLRALVTGGPADAIVLAQAVANKAVEKYDYLLPEMLLCHDYATKSLDPEGAWEAMASITGSDCSPLS